jgi:hypothetical protein
VRAVPTEGDAQRAGRPPVEVAGIVACGPVGIRVSGRYARCPTDPPNWYHVSRLMTDTWAGPGTPGEQESACVMAGNDQSLDDPEDKTGKGKKEDPFGKIPFIKRKGFEVIAFKPHGEKGD